jgi:hypothetical protein
MFNPFEHYAELVFTNIDGGPAFGLSPHATVALPDGQQVTPASPGHPETITYWLKGEDGQYHQGTHEQAFVQDLWLHFAYGAELIEQGSWPWLQAQGLMAPAITFDVMRAAIMERPDILGDIVSRGYSEAQVWAYAQSEAPNIVELIGVPHA